MKRLLLTPTQVTVLLDAATVYLDGMGWTESMPAFERKSLEQARIKLARAQRS